jgi:hypothetical protein
MTSFLEDHKLSLADVAAGQRLPIPLFPLGEWKSAKYPSLSLTKELADELIAGFEAGVLGTEPVLDSSGNHDTTAPAAGWFKKLYVAPMKDGKDMLFGDAELTVLGAQMLNDGLYKYDSIEIGAAVDNTTGKTTDTVFRSATLTNTPVLRVLPGILDAADGIAASEPVTIALSEITAADKPAVDPVQSILDDMDALAAKADAAMKGKKGMPSFRTMMREARAKLSAHALAESGSTNDLRDALQDALADAYGALVDNLYVEDFGPDWLIANTWDEGESVYYRIAYSQDPTTGIILGQPVEVTRDTTYVPVSDSSPAGAPPASSTARSAMLKATEGQGKRLAEGDAAQKGSGSMDIKILKVLQLAEGASDEAVQSAVMNLADRMATAETALAETVKAKRDGEVETKLSELIADGHVLPGQKETWLKLAETAPESFDAMAEQVKTVKAIDLGEKGTDKHGDADKAASVQLAEAADKIAAERKVDLATATDLALTENPELKARYAAEAYGDSEER